MFGIFKKFKKTKPQGEPEVKKEELPQEEATKAEPEQLQQIAEPAAVETQEDTLKPQEQAPIPEPVTIKEEEEKLEEKEETVEKAQEEPEIKPVQTEKTLEDEGKEDDSNTSKGFFAKALEKTVSNFKSIVPKKKEKIEFDLIEELLIEADMEYEIIEKAMDGLPEMISREQLRHRLVMLFEHAPEVDYDNIPKPFVELIIGVNGAGKTTTIAKLANMYKQNDKKVILGAGDTFRAAAIEQLSTWADKLQVPIIKTKQGHDASAVAYDTIHSAVAKNMDHAIIDTAGRLQTQTNLAKELKKIVKVCDKAYKGAPHQKIMILDGTQGNTAIAQARAFNEMVGIDGIIVTKLDGTAKGGALFSISNQLELPIFYIGIGEKADDIMPFSPDDFVDSLLDGIYQ